MNKEDNLRLDRQICFLFYGISRAVTQLYQPLLEPLGLTYPQYLVMLVLWEEDGASVGRVCERLYLDSGTLTPLLKRLEAAGLVRRERSTADERVVHVHLTSAGKRLKRSALGVPEALVCRVGLPPAELVRLRGELGRLFEVARGQVEGAEKEAS
jgi:DNA-binding MarR family transcriptional regulator